MKKLKILTSAMAILFSCNLHAAWHSTGWLNADALVIHMDNGKTYFSGFTTTGTCEHHRLEIRENGGFYENPENAKRMFSLILAAKAQNKRIKLGYHNADGAACRVAQVFVEW